MKFDNSQVHQKAKNSETGIMALKFMQRAEDKLKAQLKAESQLAIEQINEERTGFVKNSKSKFGGNELKLVPEEIEQSKVMEALRGKS